MKKAIVELCEKDGYWQLYDVNNNIWWSTGITSNTELKQVQVDNTNKLKQLIKLKETGFDADAILEFKKQGLL